MNVKLKIPPFHKFRILWNVILGYVYKFFVDIRLLGIPELKSSNCDIVVSLTSYGRRVADSVVYYTLVSLLRQKLQPQRLILWLADDEWSDEKLPSKIKKLRQKGVEIRYCKDIRSFKKLIPTLSLCPNNNIMTVDDDIIYSRNTVELVWKEHLQNTNEIIGFRTSMPIIENGIPSHYAEWKHVLSMEKSLLMFPIGYGGTFYPVGSLNEIVFKEDLFMKLCPLADDIWFWFCGLLNNTNKIYLKKRALDMSFDALYQYFHKGSALTHTNRFEHANDMQFKDLFEYYNVIIDNTGKLVKRS